MERNEKPSFTMAFFNYKPQCSIVKSSSVGIYITFSNSIAIKGKDNFILYVLE